MLYAMTVHQFITKERTKALRKGNAALVKGLDVAAEIAQGKRCPKGHAGDDLTSVADGTVYCLKCDGAHDTEEAVAECLTDLGIEVRA